MDYTERLKGPEVEFYEALERVIAASRTRLELNDPTRSMVLLIAGLAIFDAFALQEEGRVGTREEFLRICATTFDKARGFNLSKETAN